MDKRVLFIINHKAGKNSKPQLLEIINSHALKYAYPINFYTLGNDDAATGIKKAIDTFKPTIVCAVGGDGTVNLVSSLIYKTDISLLIIPYGSANGMAKELQIPEILTDCLDLIIKGKCVAIDLLMINDKISIHLADVGLNARIVKRFELDPKRGLFIYAKHLFYEMFVLKRKKFQIYYDEKIKIINAVSITFAIATQYGTGAVINPDGKLNDGLFEICIVKPFPKYELFKIAYQMFRNKLKTSAYFEVIQCKSALITCRRKTLLQIDGEIIGKVNRIDLTCLPQVINVLISANLDHPTLVN